MAKQKEETKEIRIKGVPESVVNDLQQIAKETGVALPSFLKTKFRDIISNYQKARP